MVACDPGAVVAAGAWVDPLLPFVPDGTVELPPELTPPENDVAGPVLPGLDTIHGAGCVVSPAR